MAALFLLVSTLLALFSQHSTNAEPVPVVSSYPNADINGIPYPFSPYTGYCPYFAQLPPFYLWCHCDLSACFDYQTEAGLESISRAYNLRLCDVQQWAAIIEGTMYGINDLNTLYMVDEIAQAARYEMDRRDLVYDPDYPGFCHQLYPPLPPTPTPLLTKRSPQTTYPDMLVQPSLSTAAMESYYMELMYFARQAMPYLSPQLQSSLLQAIYSYAPYNYMGLVDDVYQKLYSNIQSMFATMYDLTPYEPRLL